MVSWRFDDAASWDGPEWAAPERAERIRSYVVEGVGPVETRPLELELALALGAGAISIEQYQRARAALARWRNS
jgi:hypothetical protein